MMRKHSARLEFAELIIELSKLKDYKNKKALKPEHMQIIEYIASWNKDACFALPKVINRETINVTYRNYNYHIRYLKHIGIIKETEIDGIKRFNISKPNSEKVISQKDFRLNYAKVSEYVIAEQKRKALHKQKHDDALALIGNRTGAKMSDKHEQMEQKMTSKQPIFSHFYDANLAYDEANLDSQHDEFRQSYTKDDTQLFFTKNKKIKTPLYPLSRENDWEIWLDSETSCEAQAKLSPQCESLNRDSQRNSPASQKTVSFFKNNNKKTETTKESIYLNPGEVNHQKAVQTAFEQNSCVKPCLNQNKNNPEDMTNLPDQPIQVSKKFKRPRKLAERKQIAQHAINNGHLCNPLGITDNRKRSHNWKLAKDIDFENDHHVTTSQLWRHLVKLYQAAFGTEIIENMVSTDRASLDSMFSKLKEVFVKGHSFEPSNKDLALYFNWFFNPKRIAGLVKADKYLKQGVIPFQQLCGAGYVSAFYTEEIMPKVVDLTDPNVSTYQHELVLGTSRLKRVMSLFQGAHDKEAFATLVYRAGICYAIKYMVDEQNLNENQIEKNIFKALINYIEIYKRENNIEKLEKSHVKSILVKILRESQKHWNSDVFNMPKYSNWECRYDRWARAILNHYGYPINKDYRNDDPNLTV